MVDTTGLYALSHDESSFLEADLSDAFRWEAWLMILRSFTVAGQRWICTILPPPNRLLREIRLLSQSLTLLNAQLLFSEWIPSSSDLH